MKKDVFITGLASFFPNSPVSNDEMEEFLGLISGKHSKVQRIVLKQNGIKRRYYALNKNQKITHTNAEMAMLAIRKLLALTDKGQKDIELLACATATPDQILPSHASMVHGLWEEPVEIFSSAGVCLSCLQALKIAYLSIAASEKQNAICSTSELVSAMLLSKNFDIEYERCCNLGTNPYMALEKDFLRFMLSDGASCALLENHPGEKGVSLKIEWIEMDSYANETPTCMFAGAVRREDGELKSWKSFESQELVDESVIGVMPAVLYHLSTSRNFLRIRILRALATAGLFGNVAKTNSSISGAEVGCQGEVGVACAMAAAAACQLFGGTPSQIEYAAEMGLEHHLGLTCDPVCGLVQVPCIERNAIAAARAFDANAYATLSDGSHMVSFDKVVEVMNETGHALPSLYRETSEGGLAKRFKR